MTDFVSKQKQHPLKRNTVITCVQTLKRSMSEDDAISCLVIGTENKEVFFVEPDAFTILSTVRTSSKNNCKCSNILFYFRLLFLLYLRFLDAQGLYEVEFRVIASCRDSCLYAMKTRIEDSKSYWFQLPSHAVGNLPDQQ